MGKSEAVNTQAREIFGTEAAAIAERHRRIVWRVPSRNEDTEEPVPGEMEALALLTDDGDGAPADVAGCVIRALSLPQVAALRPGLLPEFPVYGSIEGDPQEEAMAGIVDAIAFGPDGTPGALIDWKNDVEPSSEVLEPYCSQVRAYHEVTGAELGLVVLATKGKVVSVHRDQARPSA